MAKFLSDFQKEFLKEFGKTKFADSFIWSGGTALSYYYLQHRESFDLDFMSTDLFPDEYILAEIKKLTANLKINKTEEKKIYNRYNFWLTKKETLKIEFIFYPFPFIEKPKKLKEFNIKIDSIKDILTNKTHAIFERSEPKDVFDFYCILQKEKIKFPIVFKWVKNKFSVEIDPVLFVGKILEGVDKLNGIKPFIVKREFYNIDKIKKYFEKEAQNYLKKIIR